MPRKNTNATLTQKQKSIRICVSSVIGITLSVLLLILSAVLVIRNDLSQKLLLPLSYTCFVMPAFFSGWICAKRIRKNGIACGTLSGIPLCVLLITLCIVFYKSISAKLMLCCLFIELASALGGICGINIKKKRRYR